MENKSLIRVTTALASVAVIGLGCYLLIKKYRTKSKTESKQIIKEDGGVKDYTNNNAAKKICDNKIVAFKCEFSAIAFMEDDTKLAGNVYELEAKVMDNRVVGSYIKYDRISSDKRCSIITDVAFMDRLQDVIVKYDIAQYNGTYHSASALPYKYGAELNIMYSSGESISAFDNQDNFLPIAAMEELEELFALQIR